MVMGNTPCCFGARVTDLLDTGSIDITHINPISSNCRSCDCKSGYVHFTVRDIQIKCACIEIRDNVSQTAAVEIHTP